MTTKQVLIGIGVLACLSVAFAGGYKYHQLYEKCPEIKRDTVYLTDTLVYYIPNDIHHYHDSLIYVTHYDTIPADVDTAAILSDYYALHEYNRTWKDTLLKVDVTDWISENRVRDTRFSYQILRPQTIITNTVIENHYNHRIYVGLDLPFKDMKFANIEALYSARRWYAGVGVGYSGFSVKGGVAVFNFEPK
jgi:hypothetical protein